MSPNWERWSTRRARRRHGAMNTKMLRKNPAVEGILSTLEEAKKQRMGADSGCGEPGAGAFQQLSFKPEGGG